MAKIDFEPIDFEPVASDGVDFEAIEDQIASATAPPPAAPVAPVSPRAQYQSELEAKWKALEGRAKTDIGAVSERSRLRAEMQRLKDPNYIPGDRFADNLSLPQQTLGATAKALDAGRGGLTAPALAALLGGLTGKDVYRAEEHGDALNPTNLTQYPGMNEIYERAGVPEGAVASDYLSMYAEPSKDLPWYQPEKGGLLDFTVRGAGGTLTDMAIDPLNYVSFGAAGAGKTAANKTAQEMAKRSAVSWGKTPIQKAIQTGGDGINAVSRATGAQRLAEYLGQSRAGRAALSATQAPSRLVGKIGDKIYSSTLQGVEDAGQVFNKSDVSGAMYRAGVKTPGAMRSEANTATDLYLAQRARMADEAAGAGASFDLDKAFEPVRQEVAELRARNTPASHFQADQLEAKMAEHAALYPRELISPARPAVPDQVVPGVAPEFAVLRPGVPDQVIPGTPAEFAVDPEFVGRPLTKRIPDLPAERGLPGVEPEFAVTRGRNPYTGEAAGIEDFRQVVPQIAPTPGAPGIPGETLNLGKDYGFRQVVPEIPEEVIPGVAAEWRQVIPEIPSEVIPGVPASEAVYGARPRITPQGGFDMTTDLYNQTGTGAWSEYLKTPEGQKAAKTLARGTRGETLDALRRAMGDKFASSVENLNADTSAILATRRAQQTAQNQANRLKNNFTTPTGTDKVISAVAMATDGGAGAAAKAVATGKMIDAARYATMPAGYYIKKASENQILAPLLDMGGRKAYKEATGRGSRKERHEYSGNPWNPQQ